MIVILFCCVLCFVAYYEFFYVRRTRELARRIPGPTIWPIIGNANIILAPDIEFGTLLLENWKKYGDRFRFIVGHKLLVVISDPQDVKEVMFKLTDKSSEYDLSKPWLGNGLALNNGVTAQWKRKIILPTFHIDILKSYLPIITKCTDNLIAKFNEISDDRYDISKLISLYTLDMIEETTMGIQGDNLAVGESAYHKAIDVLTYCTDVKFRSTLYKSDFFYHLSKYGKMEHEALKTVHEFCEYVINERQLTLKSHQPKPIDKRTKLSYLDMLLNSTYENGESLDFNFLKDDTQTILFTGHDTISVALTLTTYRLSKEPDIQRKIFDEQIAIFNGDRETAPNMGDLSRMIYLEMVIKEGLRMSSVTPAIGRRTTEEISINGMLLPKDCSVFINLLAMNYNPKFFRYPHKFDPERFSPEEIAKRPYLANAPFSSGPRNCIGKTYAMLVMKCFFSKMIRTFEFQPVDHNLEMQYSVIAKSKNGAFVNISKR